MIFFKFIFPQRLLVTKSVKQIQKEAKKIFESQKTTPSNNFNTITEMSEASKESSEGEKTENNNQDNDDKPKIDSLNEIDQQQADEQNYEIDEIIKQLLFGHVKSVSTSFDSMFKTLIASSNLNDINMTFQRSFILFHRILDMLKIENDDLLKSDPDSPQINISEQLMQKIRLIIQFEQLIINFYANISKSYDALSKNNDKEKIVERDELMLTLFRSFVYDFMRSWFNLSDSISYVTLSLKNQKLVVELNSMVLEVSKMIEGFLFSDGIVIFIKIRNLNNIVFMMKF